MSRPVTVERRTKQGLRFHYAWIVAAVTFTTLLVGAGVRTGPGVLIRPLEAEFGWDRGSISLAVAIGIFIYGLAAPFGGALLDRIGPRRVMALGLVLTAAGLGTLLMMRDLWQLHVFMGLVTGVGTGAVGGSLGAVVAARWFKTNRGMVIGLFGAATSMGQLVFIPGLMGLTATGGWRTAVGVLAVISAVMLVPVILLMRDHPSDRGLRPVGDDGGAGAAALHVEETKLTPMRDVLRGRNFWLLAGSYFICGFTTAGLITTHLIPFSLEQGFSEAMTASTMALMGAMNIVGTLSSGWLTDRYDNRRLLAAYYGSRGIALVALPFIVDAPQLILFAIIYGWDWVASVPPTVSLSTAIYGRGSLGVVYGWIFFAHMSGASIAAFSGGLLRDLFGDYNVVFALSALLVFMAAGLSLGIRRPGAITGADELWARGTRP